MELAHILGARDGFLVRQSKGTRPQLLKSKRTVSLIDHREVSLMPEARYRFDRGVPEREARRGQVSMAEQDTISALAPRLAEEIRGRLIAGELKPGQRLSEAALSADFSVSRNSLREAFRLLTKEGLLRHEPNRGMFVATPSMASIIDIYRIRRMIECQALAKAYPHHPAVARMRAAVDAARIARGEKAWGVVGSQNMVFHAAIVEMADSQRLNAFYAQIAAELRLSFGLLADPELLHAPYVDLNAAILEQLEAGKTQEAADMLEAYLTQSERTVLAAFSRIP